MSNHHRGTFIGRTTREHGQSRQHHNMISTDVGGLVFTEEKIDLPSGTRVIFDLESGATSETLAVRVQPIDQPSATTPAEPVKATPQKKGK
jgi:hypothetical protein